MEVIAELLGVPTAVRPSLRPWSNAIVRLYEPTATPAQQATAETAAADFVAALLGAAAHDPAVFGDPTRIDLARDPRSAARSW